MGGEWKLSWVETGTEPLLAIICNSRCWVSIGKTGSRQYNGANSSCYQQPEIPKGVAASSRSSHCWGGVQMVVPPLVATMAVVPVGSRELVATVTASKLRQETVATGLGSPSWFPC